jgi:hypothetical protein
MSEITNYKKMAPFGQLEKNANAQFSMTDNRFFLLTLTTKTNTGKKRKPERDETKKRIVCPGNRKNYNFFREPKKVDKLLK